LGADNEYEWIIDPLDGTTNFIHGFPHFAVSIAFRHKSRLEAGVIYDPIRQELFTTSRGEGAHLNERRIRVRNVGGLGSALLGTGFPVRYPQHIPAYLNMFGSLITQCLEMRRAGSAALDLAYVASGRLDGFWEIGLNQWDIAAGVLLVQEAGGLVGDFVGGDEFFKTGNIVAGSPKVFKALLQTIRPHLTATLAC
jgi:myo-inositol-1(or 4)-monophosphatase